MTPQAMRRIELIRIEMMPKDLAHELFDMQMTIQVNDRTHQVTLTGNTLDDMRSRCDIYFETLRRQFEASISENYLST